MQFIVFVDISVMAHWQIPMVFEFPQLQYIDRVIDVCCAAPAVRVQTWRIRLSSHSCNIDAGHAALMPVVCFDKCLGWSRQCSTLWWLCSWHSSTSLFFRAVYTGTRPGFPRHQGGEGVAGTPGARSQVFCHPIRCISRTRPGLTRCVVSHLYHTHHTQHTHTDILFFGACFFF